MTQQRWRAFADEYVKTFNAYDAYVNCGAYKARDNGARVNAFRLMQKKQVIEYIQEAIDDRNERMHISQDRVIEEVANLAFSDLSKIAEWTDDAFMLKSSADLSQDELAIISELQIETIEYGESTKVRKRVKLHNKLDALDKLARLMGMYQQEKLTVKHEFGIAHIPEPIDAESWDASVAKELAYVRKLDEGSTDTLDGE